MGAIIPRPRAGSSPVGWAAIIPHSTARAIQAIQPEAIAEAAPMGEAARGGRWRWRLILHLHPQRAAFWSGAREVLDSFQFALGPVWNRFKRGFFFLHRSTTFNIDSAASPGGLPVFHDCLFLQRP